MKLGIRIDVDTYRGTKLGVPKLLAVLDQNRIKATWYFSVGPDNMGRHLWRLIRPDFLLKMLRSNAPNLYGWDIILRGTLGPGPIIGKKLKGPIRQVAASGHEIGFHAWDHYTWQMHIEKMSVAAIRDHIRRGVELLTEAAGTPPTTSACPSWKCTDTVLRIKEEFPFLYNSDCRGRSIFTPVVAGRELSQPQIPATLPTYDEVIGQQGITDQNYNDYILSLVRPDQLNVLTIHAEVEGVARQELFVDFLAKTKARGIECVPLHDLLADSKAVVPGEIFQECIPGRDGWVACATTKLAA